MIYQPPLKEVASAVYCYVYILSRQSYFGLALRSRMESARGKLIAMSPFYFSSLSLVSSRNGVRKDRCQLCGFTTPDGRIRETFGCVVLSWSESSTRLLVVVCRTDVLRSVFGSASGCQKTSKEVVRQDIIQIILKGPWHLEFTLSLSGWNRPKRRNCCWISNSNSWAWSRHWTK